MCVRAHAYIQYRIEACYGTHVEFRRQHSEVGSLQLPRGSYESNLHYQGLAATLPAKPIHQLRIFRDSVSM